MRNSKQRLVSIGLGAALALSLLGTALPAAAAGLTAVQVQAVIGMLVAFGVDNATIANVQAVLEGTSTPTTSNNGTGSSGTSQSGGDQGQPGGTCMTLSMGLHLGSRDNEQEHEVERLQKFLRKHPDLYPEGAVTGYFGPATRKAVERWQSEHGIASSSENAGYGYVGPRTRHEMNKEIDLECETGDMSEHTASSTSEQEHTASSTSDHENASTTPSGD